jgi:hypothetical protein
MLLVTAAVAPSVSFAYDSNHHTTIAYDNGGEFAVGYDAVSALATGERKNGTDGNRVLFAKIAEFLAAEGVTTPIGELRAAGLKDAHHVIQDAAVRDLPGYDTQLAPGVQLEGPSTAVGTPHYSATQAQRAAGGGAGAASHLRTLLRAKQRSITSH